MPARELPHRPNIDPVAAFVDAACVPRDFSRYLRLDKSRSHAGVDLPCGYDEVDALLLPRYAG